MRSKAEGRPIKKKRSISISHEMDTYVDQLGISMFHCNYSEAIEHILKAGKKAIDKKKHKES